MLSALCPGHCPYFNGRRPSPRAHGSDGQDAVTSPEQVEVSLPEGKAAEEQDAARIQEPVTSPKYRNDDPWSPAHGSVASTCDNEDDSDEDAFWLSHYQKGKFNLSMLLPPLKWLPAYVRVMMGRGTEADFAGSGSLPYSLKGDTIAGLTVGFMLVPQSLAFALLAGLPVQVGLYSSFLPLVVYAIFGTIRQVQPGPTALMSLLTGQTLDALAFKTEEDRVSAAAFLALLVGGISVVLGVIRFGFIIDFMSHSVMSAFCTAAGITIGTSQLKHMFGIVQPRQKYWWKTVVHLVKHLNEVDPPTIVLGGSLLVMLIFLKQWKSAGNSEARRRHRLWCRFPLDKASTGFRVLKVVADVSSLLSVLVGWVWGLIYRASGVNSVQIIGDVEGGGFRFMFPGTALDDLSFDSVFVSAATIAVVGFLETMAVGGKFAAQNRYSYDPNQELLALGFANIGGALMSGYPTTGSFSRTAVNASFGATSLLACAISSVLVFLAVVLLLPVVALLPLAALAPIIIQGAIGVVDIHHFKVAFKANRAEFCVMFCTFAVSLALSVKEGLLVGFVLSVLKTMYDLGNPNLVVCGRLPDGSFRDIRNFPKAEIVKFAVFIRMDARLSFANARKLKEFCLKAVSVREEQGELIKFVVIDAKSINHVDLTGCETLQVLAETLCARHQRLIIANLKGPVSKSLATAGLPAVFKDNFCHLCINMEQALRILEGKDERQASVDFRDLVSRADTARMVMASSNNSFYGCSSPTACQIPRSTDRGAQYDV